MQDWRGMGVMQLSNASGSTNLVSSKDFRLIFKARFIAAAATFIIIGLAKLLGWMQFPFLMFALAPLLEMFINQPYQFVAKRLKTPISLLTINNVFDIILITWGMHFIGGMNMFTMVMIYSLVIIFSGFALPPRQTYFLANLSFVFYALLVCCEFYNIIPPVPVFDIEMPPHIRLLFVLLTLPCFNLIAFYIAYSSHGLRGSKSDLQDALGKLQFENKERLQAERALRESEEKYRSIFESLVDLFYQTDMRGTLTSVSPSCYRLSGYREEEVIGQNVATFYPYPEERDSLLKKLLKHGAIDDFEITLRAKDGRFIPASVSSRVIRDGQGRPIRVEGTVRDISSRKETEESFRKLSARNEAILGAIPDIIMEVDNNKIYTWANKAGFEFFGDDVIGKGAEDYFEGQQNTYNMVEPIFAGNQEFIYVESWQRRRDGERRLLAWWCRVLKDENGLVTGALSTARDITEARLADRRLLQTEQRYRLFIEAMHDGVGFVDLNENILFANQALCTMLGSSHKELIGENLGGYVIKEDFPKVLAGTEKRLRKEHGKYEVIMKSKNGSLRQVYISATPLLDYNGDVVGSVGIFTDITELKKAEEERKQLRDKLIRAQKMESLGILAGGVAHDLNNILGPLVAYPEIIRMNLPADSPINGHLKKIENSTQRAVDVVQDLLTMARRGRYEMVPLNLNDVIENYLQSPDFTGLKTKFPQIEISCQLDKSISQVHGSLSHLSKVVMNLVINALEAMPYGGKLIIKTEQQFVERLVGGFDNIGIGDYVLMTVSDTGLGIDKKDLKHLFEPFYTKKTMGRSGSGLGLAIVYGVMKDHNGYVDVQSEVNVGSDFFVYLPVIGIANFPAEKEIIDIRGSEKILVVDDLEEQRELASTLLASLGYKVEVAPGGRSAVEYVKSHDVDLVVLDMIMENDFDGLDTYREILKYHPGQKAIIASGYSQTDRVLEAEKMGVGKYIRKPYTMQKLGKAIREVLVS